eukprot:gene13359-biopygen15577
MFRAQAHDGAVCPMGLSVALPAWDLAWQPSAMHRGAFDSNRAGAQRAWAPPPPPPAPPPLRQRAGTAGPDASGTRPFLHHLSCGTRPGRVHCRFPQEALRHPWLAQQQVDLSPLLCLADECESLQSTRNSVLELPPRRRCLPLGKTPNDTVHLHIQRYRRLQRCAIHPALQTPTCLCQEQTQHRTRTRPHSQEATHEIARLVRHTLPLLADHL